MPAAPAVPKEKAKEEPQTAAARRTAGLPEQADSQAAEAAAGVPEQEAPTSTVTTVPGGEEVTAENITAEERDLIRRIRADRGEEILEAVRQAPVGLGTDADPYALVHARGCPHPENTETYPAERPNGVKVTVVRCVECGAQNNIDH